MLRWILRAIDRRIDGLEREVEALSRDLDEAHAELDELRLQFEHAVNNFAALQVDHMRRVVAIENHVMRGHWS